MQKGRIHSIETMGLVDGPGVRFVVFLQGCQLRCAFCHNPDTWSLTEGEEISPRELVEKIKRYQPYFTRSKGGVTFSGGEPLLQPDFLIECLKLCKAEGIHTALDTAGVGLGRYDEILTYTDLVLLDIKHIQPEKYQFITGQTMDKYNEFINILNQTKTDVWLRAVIIPGINDNLDYIRDLWEVGKRFRRIKKFELLPYHTLGINKYEALGIGYRLKDTPPMNRKHVEKWQDTLNKALISDE